MIARHDSGKKRPCVHCKELTLFVRELPRVKGKPLKTEDCCSDCGERPARRESFAKKAAA